MKVNLQAVKRDFSGAAAHYDEHALLQYEVMAELADMAGKFFPESADVLDAGCGTGRIAEYVHEHGLGWNLTGVDIAEGMCRHAVNRYADVACGDVSSLPFAKESFDAVFCSLVAQWVPDVGIMAGQFHEVLKSDGRVAVAVLDEGTLHELGKAMRHADSGEHVSEFRSVESYKETFQQAGFDVLESVSIPKIYHYPVFEDLLASLKNIGATNKRGGEKRGLMSPAALRRARDYYHEHFSNDKGIHATWNVLHLILGKS